jgi:hypothetical protein
VYTQSYLLASLFSQQLRAALRARFGSPWLRPEAAAWLVENVVHDAAAATLDQKLASARDRFAAGAGRVPRLLERGLSAGGRAARACQFRSR